MEVNQLFSYTALITTCSLQCPAKGIILTVSFRPLSVLQHTLYVSHTRQPLKCGVYFCSTVGSVVILFPRPAERPNVSASGKGLFSVINYLLTLSACRGPIYVRFLLPQAQDNLLFVERYFNVCTEHLFTTIHMAWKL